MRIGESMKFTKIYEFYYNKMRELDNIAIRYNNLSFQSMIESYFTMHRPLLLEERMCLMYSDDENNYFGYCYRAYLDT